MKKVFTLFAIVSTFYLHSQDPIFLNTNQSLVYLNPSFAGSNGGVRNQFSYSNQWLNAPGSFVTFQNTFDAYIKPLRGGIAVSYMRDNIRRGSLIGSLLSLTYAQHLNFLEGDLKIIPSFQVSYGVRRLDRSNLHFGDAIDARYGLIWNNPTALPLSSINYFSIGGGLLVNYKKNLYVGASAFNINQPDLGYLGTYKLPYRLSLHASYNIHASAQTNLQVIYRYNYQGNFSNNQLAVNAIFKNHFIVGAGYVTGKILVANLGFRVGSLTIQGGYDAHISQEGLGLSSWNIYASLNFPNKKNFKANQNFENY